MAEFVVGKTGDTSPLLESMPSKPTLSQADFARRVVGVMSEAVLILNVDLSIVTANDSSYSLLGYSREELLGSSFSKLFPEASAWVLATLGRTVVHGDEVKCKVGDGQMVPMSISASLLPDEDGGQSVVVVLRDLTSVHRLAAQLAVAKNELGQRAGELALEVSRRKRVEEELRDAKSGVERRLEETRSQLLRTERLATLGTLAGGVGHELNNVVMIQHLCIEEAKDLVEEGILDQGYLRQLEAVEGHLTNHARRLLNLARPGPDYAEPLDLRTTICDTLEILHGSGRTKYVSVQTELPDEPLMVRVNRARIEQILINLVGNAADAVADIQDREKQVRVLASLEPGGDRVHCEVGDTGSGISAPDLERVFDPFFTTKPPGRGTGLGLPVVKQIVESYGGELSVFSAVGMGTVFSFHLPAATEAPA